MAILMIVNNPNNWPLQVRGVDVVAARAYLTDPRYGELRGAKVFNLCRSYRYQTIGYYVSLLAEARGHKPLPSISTIQDLKSQTIIRFVSEELQELIQKSLAPIQSREFALSIYFGKNLAHRYDRLSLQLFNLFPAPLLRAYFVRNEAWQLQGVEPIAVNEVPEDHRPFLVQSATEHFSRSYTGTPRRSRFRYDLAILHNPEEKEPPSNEKALHKFVKAARSLGMNAELITRDDFGRIAEFDALFIRETTGVNHYTYRFARRAAAEGLVVIDDPESILRCANKVYLAELMERRNIPIPRTMIVHKDNVDAIEETLGLPCILKEPDSSFSRGVVRIDRSEDLRENVERMINKSDLVIAQEYLPTEFDWRVGIFDYRPIYVCKYYMAEDHWQIIKRESSGEKEYGNFETLPVEFAPLSVVRTAVRAARLIGDGLYGVDLKQVGKKTVIVEINENPNIDAGIEDEALKDELYTRITGVFLKRLERMKEWKMRP